MLHFLIWHFCFFPFSHHYHFHVNFFAFLHIFSNRNIFHSLYYNNLYLTHLALPNICVNNDNSFQRMLMGQLHSSKKSKKSKIQVEFLKAHHQYLWFYIFLQSMSICSKHFVIPGVRIYCTPSPLRYALTNKDRLEVELLCSVV